MQRILGTLVFFLLSFQLFAQAPYFFNYQAAVRDDSGEVMKDQQVNIKISLLEGSESGITVYTENHLVETSQNGIVNFQIGNGSNQLGSIAELDWKNKQYWLEVEMDREGGNDFMFMNKVQLLSVPYALHAQSATMVDDADANPINELQSLSIEGDKLSISEGNTVDLALSLDQDVTNEIQDLSANKFGNFIDLAISHGGEGTSFDISDPDSDNTNELQFLELASKRLYLSQANSVDLSSFENYWKASNSWDPYGIYYWGGVYMDTVTIDYKLKIGDNNPLGTEIFSNNIFMNDKFNDHYFNLNASEARFEDEKHMNHSFLNKDSLVFNSDFDGIFAPSHFQLNAKDLFFKSFSKKGQLNNSALTFETVNELSYHSSEKMDIYQKISQDSFVNRMSLMGDSLSFSNIVGQRTLMMGTYPQENVGYLHVFDGKGMKNIHLGSKIDDEMNNKSFGELQMYSNDSLTLELRSEEEGGSLNFTKKDGTDLASISPDQNGRMGLNFFDWQGKRKALLGLNEFDSGSLQIINEDEKLMLSVDENGLNLWNQLGSNAAGIGKSFGSSNGGGIIYSNDAYGNTNFIAGSNYIDNLPGAGFAGIYDNFGFIRASMKVNADSEGQFFGNGYFLDNLNGKRKGEFFNNPVEDAGVLNLYGPNDNLNVTLGYNVTNENWGQIYIHDENGDQRAGLFIRSNTGLTELFADVKHFKMDHPEDPGKEIWYASVEGPEAAAYIRGTAKLVDGECQVELPDHFLQVANEATMTVILTPLYWDTYGLAVAEKSDIGFKVKELKGANGNFEFDWEVKCVRSGFEDYKVIRGK